MVLPPGAPTAIRKRLFSVIMVGVILERGVFLGAILLASLPTNPKAFGTPGAAEKSSISLFKTIPVPGVTIPAPKPRLIVKVKLTAFLSASTTFK